MVHLLALGHAVITIGVTRLTSASETLFAAALYLVSEAGCPVQRARVLELLWPNATGRRANHCLRQTIYRLNAFGAALRADRGHIVLPAHAAQSDCGELLRAGESVDPDRVAKLVQGPFLPGYSPHFSAAFNAWLERRRDVVGAGLRRVLVSAIAAKRERNDWAAVESLATRCLVLDPLNEEATLAIAEAAAVHGSKVRALEILDSYLRELGPAAGDIRLPAAVLRRRIAETYRGGAVNRREIPQVGRESEMRELGRVLRAAQNGQGGTVLVRGEPGSGKSRLLDELGTVHSLLYGQFIRITCVRVDRQMALSAVLELGRQLLECRGAIGCAPESLAYLRRLFSAVPTEPWSSPQTSELETNRLQARRALFELIDAIAAESLLVIAIDDVQWADDSSVNLIGALTAWITSRRVVVVLTMRQIDHWNQLPCSCDSLPTTLQLRPISLAASRQLVRRYLAQVKHRERENEFTEWCVVHGAGNPYLLRKLAEDAEWNGVEFSTPRYLTPFLTAPIKSLSPTARRVFEAVAVLGRFASVARVESMLDEPRVQLLACLDELERAGFVASVGGVLTIQHPLAAQAVLTEMASTSLHFLHRKSAELLQDARVSDRSLSLALECARHWQGCGAPRRAMRLLRSHAQRSINNGAPKDAARALERARLLTQTGEERKSILSGRLEALLRSADWVTLAQIGGEPGKATRGQRDTAEHSDTELYVLQARWRLGHDHRELCGEAMTCLSSRVAPHEHRLGAATCAVILADNLCDPKIARSVHRSVQSLLRSADLDPVLCKHFHLLYETAFGDLSAAAEHAHTLIAYARESVNPSRMVRYLIHSAATLRVVGTIEPAISVAAEALAHAEANGLQQYAAAAANQLLQLNAISGSLSLAKEYGEKALELLRGTMDPIAYSSVLSNCAELAILDCRVADAEQLLQDCEHYLGHTSWLRAEAHLSALRWQLKLMKSEAKPVSTELSSLRQIFRQTRACGGQDRLAMVIAQLMWRAGQKPQARQLFDEYLVRYRRERHSPPPDVAKLRLLLSSA